MSFWDTFSQVSDLQPSWRPHRSKFLTSYLLVAKPEDSFPTLTSPCFCPTRLSPTGLSVGEMQICPEAKELESRAPPLHPRPWEGASGLAFMALALPFSRDDPSPASGHPSSRTCCCSGLLLLCRPSLLPCPLLAAHLQGVVAGSPEGVRPRRQDPESLPHSTRQTLPGHIQYLILRFCVKKTSWNSEKL